MLRRIVLSRRSAIRGRASLRADEGVQCPNGMQDSRLLLRTSSTPWKLHSQASHRKTRGPRCAHHLDVSSGEDTLKEVFARFLPQTTFRRLRGVAHLSPLEAPDALADACNALLHEL